MATVAVTTQPTYRVGPNTGFKATGTIQGVDGEFKDDLLVQGDLEVVGTLYTDLVSFGDDLTLADGKDFTMHADGTGTFTTGVGDVTLNGDVIIGDGKDITMHADGTGTFTTGTGAVTLNGDVTIAANMDLGMSGTSTFTTGTGAISLNGDVALVANKNFVMGTAGSGSGIIQTGTGNISLNGATTVAGSTTLAVTTADRLTVGGVIVPQELVLMHKYAFGDADHTIFIANRGYSVVAVSHMSEVADTAVGAATIGVVKCTGTQAPSAGVLVTTATCDAKTVTQTVTAKTPSATPADLVLAAGDRIALDFTGLTDGTGIIMVTLKRV